MTTAAAVRLITRCDQQWTTIRSGHRVHAQVLKRVTAQLTYSNCHAIITMFRTVCMSIDKSVNVYELHLSAYSDFSLFSSVGLVKFFVFFLLLFVLFSS